MSETGGPFIPAQIEDVLTIGIDDVGTAKIATLKDERSPKGDCGQIPKARIEPEIMTHFLNPFPLNKTYVELPFNCKLRPDDPVQVVISPVIVRAEDCPIDIEGYEEAEWLENYDDELPDPQEEDEYVWADQATLPHNEEREEVRLDNLPDLALVLYNHVGALISGRCPACDYTTRASCTLYQMARSLNNTNY